MARWARKDTFRRTPSPYPVHLQPVQAFIFTAQLRSDWRRFCGALCCVAQTPELIRELFLDPRSAQGKVSPEGVYSVRLCVGGAWRQVCVYFPPSHPQENHVNLYGDFPFFEI